MTTDRTTDLFKLNSRERALASFACAEYAKKCVTHGKNCKALTLPELEVDIAEAGASAVVNEIKITDAKKPVQLGPELRKWLRNSLQLLYSEVIKVKDKQIKLDIGVEETEEREQEIRNLANKVGEQLDLIDAIEDLQESLGEGGTATFESGGKSATIHGKKNRRNPEAGEFRSRDAGDQD